MPSTEPREESITIDYTEGDTLPVRFIGRYRLIRELAAGGMATVHLATAESAEGFSKLVAIKLIHEHLARDQTFVDMFLDEARIVARVEHANVCSVFDFGQQDGTYFIAMEYLAGETFAHVRDAVRRRGADARWPMIAASLVMQACEGLHAAHELCAPDGSTYGVVHRDVSPHNLFVTFGGVVKVVDFGIARAEGRSHHTTPGMIKGKFAYMAPEQITGLHPVDRRADIWALGVTLWEMIALRPLFKKSSAAETLSRVMSEEILAPSMLVEGVPPELDAIVLRALSRNPAERYETAREFARDLARHCRKHDGPLNAIELEEWLVDLAPEARREKLSLAASAREHSISEPGVPRPGRVSDPGTMRPGERISETRAKRPPPFDGPRAAAERESDPGAMRPGDRLSDPMAMRPANRISDPLMMRPPLRRSDPGAARPERARDEDATLRTEMDAETVRPPAPNGDPGLLQKGIKLVDPLRLLARDEMRALSSGARRNRLLLAGKAALVALSLVLGVGFAAVVSKAVHRAPRPAPTQQR